jgi:glycosyltransferase involved in cell wall biosynthesis
MISQAIEKLKREDIKIAYIHTMSFPNNEANAFDAVWTAAVLTDKVDTTFFIPRLKTSVRNVKNYYYISGSPLRFQSMYLNFIPDRFLLKNRNYYEKMLFAYLRYHPAWSGYEGQKVIYIRDPKALRFWGLQREHQKWLRDWIMIYEAHDPLGFDPNKFQDNNPFIAEEEPERQLGRDAVKAAMNFDAIICNSKVLAEDLKTWTDNKLNPHVITIASPLQRLTSSPQIHFGEKIIIGYIGTIDKLRGVDILLEAIKLLPQNCSVRLVGRFRHESGVNPNWLTKYTSDPANKDRLDINIMDHIADVTTEIDRCDILIQPASHDVLDSRYATPQKAFGYMARGKPIIAGDVPCNRDLFKDGKSAVFYHINPQGLADCIVNLVINSNKAEEIAIEAWKQSIDYTYSRRANDILSLVTRYFK